MADIREFRFPDAAAAAAGLAQAVADRLADAIAQRGVATLLLSGGRSPALMFEALRDIPLPWGKVIITQVDERWVPTEHPDSNGQMIRRCLLQGAAAAARFIPMKNDGASARAGQPAYEAALDALPRPFDVIVLGMGEDGHTASLFPQARELAEGLTTQALTLSVTPPVAPHERLSLSVRGLLECRALILQIGGAAKEAVYRAALAPGAVEDMPVRAILRQDKVPVEVWISTVA